jgi:hypothetical protein
MEIYKQEIAELIAKLTPRTPPKVRELREQVIQIIFGMK